ncbi:MULTISPECIES: multidrug ABC transporter ATPase [Comamonas]|uniref:hypothetical protein n=1 Tax=Comamonas TaxID=283 RepID=UPI00237EE4CC|nr:multidrug ABC transporter ATPase [Comamonas aquatica]MDE1556622.1 multidrug ABC transporter ATPase [Comamonas aquatica]MDH0900516.1 multidrug ABC transporter ATPase [Comamonas aquatica]
MHLPHLLRHPTLSIAVLLAAAAASPSAWADDEQACAPSTIAAVARWAGVSGPLVPWETPGGLIAAAACKPLPDAPETTIAAIAFDTLQEGPTQGDGSKLQVVALVEHDTVVAAHRAQIEEDATTAVGRYHIDTARYRLSPSVRAFGTVFHSHALGSRCGDANAGSELTLWVREGPQLRPVLGTNLRGWISIVGTPCMLQESLQRSEEARITLAVEKTSRHGFADLSLTAHVTQHEVRDGAAGQTRQRRVRTVLRYDGQSYGSDMFRDFWYPASLRRP